MQQLRVPGDEQRGQRAAEGEPDPRLLQQEAGLLGQAAAQPRQVHGHRAEGHPLRAAHGPEEVQVGQQAVDPAEALAEGVHPVPAGAGHRFELQQDVLEKAPHLADKAVQLPLGEGGLRGGAEEEQVPLPAGDPAEQIERPVVGKGARPLRVGEGTGEKFGGLHPHGQLRELAVGGPVEPQDPPLGHLDGPLREALQM